ncbi:hypothetical protein SLS59_004175 [Nothophoma quercina]|uniref:Uncharacterized protein n=1 Tax=Nothophoma quercina TaxID=749835 RepID=A0ABR3RKH3_9PLEO
MTPAPGPIIPEPPAQTFKTPNLIPVTPHHARISKDALLAADPDQDEEPEEEQLPQIWHPSIDDLIRRTARDYDLVMNYERDAEGGQRWLQDDIARIRDVGKHLHGDIFALRRWQRVVTEQGELGPTFRHPDRVLHGKTTKTYTEASHDSRIGYTLSTFSVRH